MLPIDSQAEKSKPSFISARNELGYWLPRFTFRFSPARKKLFWRHPVLPRQRENYIANLPFCPIITTFIVVNFNNFTVGKI
jgi:hypothetical protein